MIIFHVRLSVSVYVGSVKIKTQINLSYSLLPAITLGLQGLLIVVPSASMVLSGFNLFPTNFEQLPMEMYSIPYRLRDFAYRDKDTYTNKITRTLINSGYPSWERGLYSALSSLDIFFDTTDGNVFTADNLRKIQNIENDLIATTGYQTEYCQTFNSSLSCIPPTSIIRYFDGTYSSVSATLNDPTFSNIPAVLYEAYTNNATSEDFKYFLPKTFTLTPTVAKATMTRTTILIGCSLSGTAFYGCTMKKIREATGTFLSEDMKEKLEYYRTNVDQFDIYYYSWAIWVTDVMKQAMKDMTFAIGSMSFIFFFMTFHTRSLWIAGFAVMSILTSFMCANIIYRCIIGFEYFGFFHILGIFIVLGIGADDLFVFYDAWRLTAYQSYPSLSHRLSDAYKKSIFSMAFTSLTTMVAFLCSAISPLLATRSFGVFAALTVFITYMSVVIFFPTVIIMYHTKFEQFEWPCYTVCKRKGKTDKNDEKEKDAKNNTFYENGGYVVSNGDVDFKDIQQRPTTQDNINYVRSDGKSKTLITVTPQNSSKNVLNGVNGLHGTDTHSHSHTNEIKPQDMKEENKNVKKQKRLVVFFRDYYFRFITHTVVRCVCLPVFLAVIVAFAYQASTLEPDNENVCIFNDCQLAIINHNYHILALNNIALFNKYQFI